jgi:L-alanine-DL-glutamate epimerase-like enolase superfamily enzyme
MGQEHIGVQSVGASAYEIPTEGPESDGTLAWDSTTMILVTAEADGVRGLGWTYGSPAVASLVTGPLAEVVTGGDVMDLPGAAERMNRAVRNIGREGIASMAISAIDIALWDLKARLLDVSVAALAGQVRADVPVYGSGGFITYDDTQTRDQLSSWVHGEGIPRVKIKIGESWGAREARDRARVALARDVIGPDTEFYVDANGAYRTGQAVRVGTWLSDYGVTWFEEPVSSQDLAGLAEVRRQIRPDVTAGEYSWTIADSARLLDAGSVDCLQIDATRCGGITGFLSAAVLAEAHSTDVSAHCAPNVHAHACAAVAGLRHLEYFHDHQRIERMLFDGALDPAGGVLTPDLSRPGLGLTFREQDAAAYRIA